MSKKKKIAATAVIVACAFLLIDYSMQKIAAQREGYSHKNIWAYYLYTDSDIRNAPRLSRQVHFTWVAQDGSQPQESSIVYHQKVDINQIRDYLRKLGYECVERSSHDERWERSNKTMPAFYISQDNESGTTTLSKSRYR
ncbi:hypothetical protein AAGQ96_20305 [Pantoea sp. MBD-2R]|uniref:hypothetical protein n=1 Tax=Pantoea sp. MBD-2R TaxID=3141540 RepID=UPI0031835A2E